MKFILIIIMDGELKIFYGDTFNKNYFQLIL